MEMPRCCALCDLEHWDEDAYGDEMNHRCCMYRKGYTAKVRETGRLPDCPLDPLPAGHGRIVDAAEVIEKADNSAWFDGDVAELGLLLESEVTTIVPAEGGKK
jgi:hypothetical protein